MTFIARAFTALLLTVFCTGPVSADPPPAENAAIEHLISCVAKSNRTFVRNGEEHKAEEAAAHVREKYSKMKSEIATAEDFIDRAASKSLLTGSPYLIKLENGAELEVKKWLGTELAKYRRLHSAQ